MSEVFKRQRSLHLKQYPLLIVIGAGGTGSWVTYLSSLIGCFNTIIVVDNDYVEEHNLNRTPYRRSDIGKTKVRAIKEIVNDSRNQVLLTEQDRWGWEDIAKTIKEAEENEMITSKVIVIDCSDNLNIYKEVDTSLVTYFKLSYDGFLASIKHGTVGNYWESDEGSYSFTSSYLVPPIMLAALAIGLLCEDRLDNTIPNNSNLMWENIQCLLKR